ncbi:MAG: YcxB family protein [Lachnospiraceae bacterium]|nr:YcxB family protein [Candidatus Colinaster scatohippi]
MPLFSCEQTYTKELYYEYAWCAYHKLRSYKKLIFGVILVVLAVALIFAFFGRYFGAVLLVLSLPIYPIALKKSMNKQIENVWESNQVYKNFDYHVDFYDDYLEIISENGTNKVVYDKLYGILESEHVLALMVGNNQGNMFDKSKMSDELIAFLKTKARVIE